MDKKRHIVESAYRDYAHARNRLRVALERAFPRGKKVNVYLSSRQNVPSLMEVVSVHSDGTVTLKMERPDKWRPGRVREFICNRSFHYIH